MGVRQHLSHVIPGDPEERVCPACGRGFKTSQGMLSHLKQARTCRWYKNGKNRDLSGYSMPQIIRTAAQTNVAHQGSMQDVDAPDFDDIMEQHNLFELVPPVHDYDQHGASSSSSSSAGPSNLNLVQRRALLPPSLNDDEDTRVIDELDEELAGRVVRMSEAVVEKWKAYFWEEPAEDEEDDRMEVDGEEGATGAGAPKKPPIDPQMRWRPFASELDWRVAMWAVREDVSQGALNRLLAIPGVSKFIAVTVLDTY